MFSFLFQCSEEYWIKKDKVIGSYELVFVRSLAVFSGAGDFTRFALSLGVRNYFAIVM